jgi:hypothetical protein
MALRIDSTRSIVHAGEAPAHLAAARRVDRLVAVGVRSGLGLPAPGRGEGRSVATEASLHHAVELVDAERDGLHERCRIADPHEVAGAILGQFGDGRRQGGQHLGPGLPDRQPADPITVESELDRAASALSPHRLADPTLDDAEQRLVDAPMVPDRPCRPCRRALDGEADHLRRAGQRRADVEHHLDVGSDRLLHGNGALWVEAMP